MSYIIQDFNIKTFPSETLVFRDGVFCPDLSSIKYEPINKKYKLPIHIIYFGEITGKNVLNIELNTKNQPVFISVKIKNKKPAFFNIYIKNTGENSEIKSVIMLENHSDLKFNCVAEHYSKNTGIFVKTRLVAYQNSISELSTTANIGKNCKNCNSDVSLSAIAEKGSKIKFLPAQKMSSIPKIASHSASIYIPTKPQIEFLYESGMNDREIKRCLHDAFLTDIDF